MINVNSVNGLKYFEIMLKLNQINGHLTTDSPLVVHSGHKGRTVPSNLHPHPASDTHECPEEVSRLRFKTLNTGF